MPKQIVHFHKEKVVYVVVGDSAYVYPIDHTSDKVSNTMLCRTSKVLSKQVDAEGKIVEFETMNSIYKAL